MKTLVNILDAAMEKLVHSTVYGEVFEKRHREVILRYIRTLEAIIKEHGHDVETVKQNVRNLYEYADMTEAVERVGSTYIETDNLLQVIDALQKDKRNLIADFAKLESFVEAMIEGDDNE